MKLLLKDKELIINDLQQKYDKIFYSRTWKIHEKVANVVKHTKQNN